MTKRRTADRDWLSWWYLLLTPLFALLDAAVDLPLRAAAIPEGGWRWLFYGSLLAIGTLCRLLPAVAPLLAVLESGVAVGVLIIASFQAVVLTPGQLGPPSIGVPWLLNLLLCGTVGIAAFQQAMVRLQRGPTRI